MKNKKFNDRYQIKVNRITSENEKSYPNQTNIKIGYFHVRKSPHKNPILYNVKLKPEIIINEYHQTSNNINTNINIKTNQSENSDNNNININKIGLKHNSSNISFNKYYREGKNKNSKKNEKNYMNNSMNKSFNNNIKIRNISYINSESNLETNDKNRNNSLIFSPIANDKKKDIEYKKRDINYMKNIKSNPLNKYNKRISDYIFQSLIANTKNNKNSFIIEKFTNYDRNIRTRKNNSQDSIKDRNDTKYKIRNSSVNSLNYNFQTNTLISQSSMNSFREKKIKEMNDMVFSSGGTLNDIFKNKLKIRSNNLITNDSIKNNNIEVLNIKLEYYRIKLFKEFLKHFELFYKNYINKDLKYFFNYLKDYKKYKYRNKNKFVYNKKYNIKNYNTIENNITNQSNILNSNNQRNNLIEVFRKSTINDNYNFYNQLKKNKNIDTNLSKIFNNSTLAKEVDNSDYNTNINNSVSINSNNNNNDYINYNLNSAPRVNKHLDNLIIKRNNVNKCLFPSNSKSPSLRIGNKTLINPDISFGVEGNENENKLYRDSKELQKKYEQIQRRKQKSKKKIGDISLNQSKEVNTNDSIKNSDEYNEFVKLRKHVQKTKSKKKLNQSDLNINQNINKIKNKKKEGYFYNNYYDKRLGDSDKKANNDNNKKISTDKESKNDILNKEQKDSNTINSIIDKKNTNNNDDKNTLKGRVNFYRRYKNIRNKNNNNNDKNDKNANNYNYRIIQPNPKLNNTPRQNNQNSTDDAFIPILIKNIVTKDKRININIYYYIISQKNKPSQKMYNSLTKSDNCSLSLFGDVNKRKNNVSKLKFRLASIKEEDVSNQNSKFYDENGTIDKINTYESKKSYNNQHN